MPKRPCVVLEVQQCQALGINYYEQKQTLSLLLRSLESSGGDP